MSLKRKIIRQRENQKLDSLSQDPTAILDAIAAVQQGLACLGNGDVNGAIHFYKEAINCNPKFAEAHYVLGVALRQTGDMDGALSSLRMALTLKPDHPDACFHLANLLNFQGEYTDAIELLQKTIEMDTKYIEAYNVLGQLFFKLFLFEKSRLAYEAGLEIAPDHSGIYHNLALALEWLGRRADALTAIEKAIELAPHNISSLSYFIATKSHLCDWKDIDMLSEKAVNIVMQKPVIVDPFAFQGFPTAPDNEKQFICATKFGTLIKPNGELRRQRPEGISSHAKLPGQRIRIGYVSMDFRAHPMAYLMTDVLHNHDRNDFEIFAYSFGPPDNGPERQRFIDVVDHFTDIQSMTNFEAAQRIYDDYIDILIDRKGYTFGNRLEIFSHRPAPIQVNYLAFGGTMGVDFIDYAVLDAFVVPPDQQQYYSEKLVYLPDTYQPNSARPVSDITPSRAECGLPDAAFVFCGFNQTYKITPKIFDVWMRILHRTPGSVLWLLKPDETTAANLRREAAARGIDPERLAFAPKMRQPQHLARHRHVDLFLDTLVINALTTASDVLFMGAPVITCPGETFVARGAGSILRALEVPELIVNNIEEYEELAVAMAANPDRLRALRDKIEQKKKTAPLFNSKRYTRHLDAAYREMWRLHQTGGNAKSFSVATIEQK